MKHLHLLLLASALLGVSGCPTRNKYDRMPTVRITSPAIDPTYTNGAVQITAIIDPPLNLPIVLRRDDDIQLATLTSASDTFEWNTTGVPEGVHAIVAEVALSEGIVKSAPVRIVVDRQAPTVILTPGNGAMDVMLRSPVKAEFSEPILLSQPASSTFSVTVFGTPAATHAALDSENRVATITFDDLTSLSLPAAFTATIAPAITDRAGNPLDPPNVLWSWNVPEWIKMPPFAVGGHSTMTIGANLRPVLAWPLFVPGTVLGQRQIQVAECDGLQWNAFDPPSGDLNSASGGYGIAFDAQNRPMLAWLDRPVGGLRVASWTGSDWDTSLPVIPLQAGPASNAVVPALREDHAGHPVVMWTEDRTTSPLIYSLARWTGTSWYRDFGAIPASTSADMVLDDSGNPIIAWANFSTSVASVSSWTGSVWTASPTLSGVREAYLTLDVGGRPVLVGDISPFEAFHIGSSNTWEPFTPIPAPSGNYGHYPRLTAGPDHLPVIAWVDILNSSARTIGLARWTGTTWDARAGLFTAGVNNVDESPQVIVDRQGSVWVGWRDENNVFNVWMSNY